MPTTPCPISDCFAATVFALQISGTVRDTPPDRIAFQELSPAPLRCARLTDCCIDTWPAVQRDGEPAATVPRSGDIV